MGGASNIAALGPSYRRGGSVNTGETVFFGENKNGGTRIIFSGHFEDEGDILKRNFIAFKSFPLKTTFA